jgi:hypothetical protein
MPRATEPHPAPPAAARGGFTYFFYGTLCDADVRIAVFGRPADAVPAVLADYEAVPAERGRFPLLQFRRGREAHGVLCAGITLPEAARLGVYEHEGRDYTARILAVRDGGGAARRAWVYLPTAVLRRGPGRWDLEEWRRFAKREFLARVQRWMRGVEQKELEPFLELWRKRMEGGA